MTSPQPSVCWSRSATDMRETSEFRVEKPFFHLPRFLNITITSSSLFSGRSHIETTYTFGITFERILVKHISTVR